jgi:hypothetical protein
MPAYKIAACRHWNDAQHLEAEGRLPNADQLYGIAAECALKSVMLGLGMEMTPDARKPKSSKYGHINKLWPEFLTFAEGHSGASYASLIPAANSFGDWAVDDRYEDGTGYTAEAVQAHCEGAEKTIDCMNLAILDGVAK